ncbi:MAG TPA: radical SAM protein, partial [Myxococcales bacterium]
MQLPVLDRLILGAQRPARYAGGELNAIRKDLSAMRCTWALAFPDTYEVGMSNVGYRLLYHALNERPDVACERVFMPWPDMERALRAERRPLFSIESRAPLRDFHVLGFTLQFELCYTTVLAMLELGGIALFASERGREDPLVLGGGPCTYNPEPVADFFDAFVIGEGEEVVHEISDAVASWKASGAPRKDLLWLLSEIPGVYVPSLFRAHYGSDRTISRYQPLKPGYESIVRRVIPDLNLVPQAERPIVPFMQAVHDRLPLEIQRGCTRGCRFCQVGMITRPTRQRDPNEVRQIAEKGLASTGYEEVGFLSLSAGDYSCIDGVLEDFFDEFGP